MSLLTIMRPFTVIDYLRNRSKHRSLPARKWGRPAWLLARRLAPVEWGYFGLNRRSFSRFIPKDLPGEPKAKLRPTYPDLDFPNLQNLLFQTGAAAGCGTFVL